MALQEILSSLAQLNNIVLAIVLIIVFLIGYKILQTVVQILIIAVTSGAFLAAMHYIGIGPELNVSNTITFMILGVGLYILYSSLQLLKTGIDSAWDFLSSKLSGSDDSSKLSKEEKRIVLQEMDED